MICSYRRAVYTGMYQCSVMCSIDGPPIWEFLCTGLSGIGGLPIPLLSNVQSIVSAGHRYTT